MKKQTYISYLEDSNGNMINFERWGYKKTSTIIKSLKKLYNEYYFSYKDDLMKSERITIYATPNGYEKEETPAITLKIKDIIEKEN